jgi:hypothetical protein
MKKIYTAVLFLGLVLTMYPQPLDTVVLLNNCGLKFTRDNFNNLYAYQWEGNALTKTDFKGNFLWQKNLPGRVNMMKTICAADNNIYITGTFNGTCEMDGFKIKSVQKDDIFIARLGKDGKINKLKRVSRKENKLIVQFFLSMVFLTASNIIPIR